MTMIITTMKQTNLCTTMTSKAPLPRASKTGTWAVKKDLMNCSEPSYFLALSMFRFVLFPVAMKYAIKAVLNYPHHQNYILHIE